ncbi:MAG: hypothetical protein IKD78_11610 [Bacteroidales bacterium]|nr:hypothetical protein [Bacteroidales bacterium]
MKKIFLEYLNKQLEKNQAMLATNSLSEEDRKLVDDAIADLNATIEAVDALEGENAQEAIDALKETVDNLQQGLTAVQEKLNQKNQEQTEPTMNENYLQSKNSVKDFCNAIRNAKNGEEFRANWEECLSTNGITISQGSEDAFIPAAVKGRIEDIWDREAGWLKDLNDTGAKRFYVRHNTSDQTAETSRAKGWKSGEKAVQSINFASKLLQAMPIYKIQSLSVKDEWNSDDDLLDYILGELVSQILFEIKRAILVGDGRAANSPYKIDTFEAVVKNATDDYTTVATASSTFLVDDVRTCVDAIHNPSNKKVTVFMSKETLRTLARVQASAESTPVFLGTAQVCEQINADEIVTTDLLGNGVKCVAMILGEYYMVGANILNPVLYSWHEGLENTTYWRYEAFCGGGINGLKSTSVLKA